MTDKIITKKKKVLKELELPGVVHIAWLQEGRWFRPIEASKSDILPSGVFLSKEEAESSLEDFGLPIPSTLILEVGLANLMHGDLLRIADLPKTYFSDSELINMLKSKVKQLFHTEIFSKRIQDGKLI